MQFDQKWNYTQFFFEGTLTFEGTALVSLRKIRDNSLSQGKSKGQNSLTSALF